MLSNIRFAVICLLFGYVISAFCVAQDAPPPPEPTETEPQIQRIDMTSAAPPSDQKFTPGERHCYLYPDYNVLAWWSPGPGEPVAIVRKRAAATTLADADCSSDSLPGDFVLRSDGTEYFSCMWGDLLLTDCGTSNIRELILYDVPSRSRVFSIGGFSGTEGWIDSVTVKIWALAAYDMPRSLCPDIQEIFVVGVDSLFALDIENFTLTALGPWRCRQLQ